MKIKEIETISKRLSLLIVILREENRMKEKEEQRLIQLKAIEEEIHNSGVEYICGIDEAGRGPLAGPVVIAAAIMPRNSMIEGVNDSKKVSEKKREEKEAAEELAMAKELAATIEDKSVTVYMKTGEGGRTFGTISTKEVAAAVKEQLGLEVDKKKMKLDEPIKTLGTHIIALKLHKDVTAKLTVKVVEK